MGSESTKRHAGKASHCGYIEASLRLHSSTLIIILKNGDYKGLPSQGHSPHQKTTEKDLSTHAKTSGNHKDESMILSRYYLNDVLGGQTCVFECQS